jgi:hypothetical protein
MSATKKQVERLAEEDPQTVVVSTPLFEQSAKNLKESLAGFQRECPVIHKGTQGYGYTYADLPAILSVINPLLEKWRLGFSQPLDGNKVKTIIFHVDTGETLESSIDIPQG